MAETKSTKKDQPMLDPIAYRSDYPEENIIGATPATTEVTEKYVGEGTNNVYHPYNKNLTIDQLDTNYQYGQPAKDINAIDDSYITRRNDMIASALYNEGKVGYNDVVNFLQGQNNWYNSTEEDRATTTSNVWNRLGQISAENPKEENKEADTSKMESDLNKDTSGVIYGKTTADSGNPEKGIQTSEDVNSPFRIMEEARVAQVKALLAMDDSEIAVSMFAGINPYGEQAMTDFQSYYPERYANIQNILKQLVGQANVDAITNGGEITTVADRTDTTTQTTNYAVNNATLSVSATQLLKSIDSILESNDTAKSAKDLMGSIENDMAKLKNRLQSLNKEAHTVFKGDASDQLVKAYINNKTQEIQNQLSILEDRYNAAYKRWDRELTHAEREAEEQDKKDSLELEWYKAKNSSKNTSDSDSDKNYTVAERNNNPLNMTVDFMKVVGAELGVDYEVGTDSFVNSNGGRQYYAKLIGDPVDTTINVLDKALSNGVNPFTTTSWSYINKLGLTKEKWKNMSLDEKREMINKWLPYEGGKMENMEYYRENPGVEYISDKTGYGYKGFEYGFDKRLEPLFKSYLENGKLGGNASTYTQIKNLTGYTDEEIGIQLKNWQKYNQNQFNSAGMDVLEAMAAFWLAADTKEIKTDSGEETVFNKTWTWDYGVGGGDARAALEDILNEKLLQRYVEARQRGVSFGQTTEAEWDIMNSTNRLKKNVKFSSSDKDFTEAYKDLLQGVWEQTFHSEYNENDWKQYLEDMKAGRTNINVALLTNTTAGVRQSTTSANDAISNTFTQFQTGNNQGNVGGVPSISSL